jgi:hypothetical protein
MRCYLCLAARNLMADCNIHAAGTSICCRPCDYRKLTTMNNLTTFLWQRIFGCYEDPTMESLSTPAAARAPVRDADSTHEVPSQLANRSTVERMQRRLQQRAALENSPSTWLPRTVSNSSSSSMDDIEDSLRPSLMTRIAACLRDDAVKPDSASIAPSAEHRTRPLAGSDDAATNLTWHLA